MNRNPFALGEWYHCFTRGVDKRRTFLTASDYQKFLSAVYLCNSKERSQDHSTRIPYHDALQLPRGEQLVAIGAYCLMPNHFHILIKEVTPGGIARFMQKLGTSYSMYFNKKHDRVGNLFVKPFRSKHVDDDVYFRQAISYIHLNPADILLPSWKNNEHVPLTELHTQLKKYKFSSLRLYEESGGSTPLERALLDDVEHEFIRSVKVDMGTALTDAIEYHKERFGTT